MQRKSRSLVLLSVFACGCAEKQLDVSGDAAELGDSCRPARVRVEDDDRAECTEGLVCEVAGDPDADGQTNTVCAAPVTLQGLVFDALSLIPIEGALVAALAETGNPVSDVAVTDAMGRYVLSVSARRDPAGELAENLNWTLFVHAADYQPFPAGLRPALPIHARDAAPVSDDDGDHVSFLVENLSTHVALLELPPSRQGGRTISGRVGSEDALGAGTLVVAEPGPDAPYTIADATGNYRLFNVPEGDVTIVGYRQGTALQPVSVPSGVDEEGIDLSIAAEASIATVTGSISLVNAPGDSSTSVVLVPVSVFNETLELGPVPMGLRAPEPPLAPSIGGAFSIPGVPPGRYKVLAAFENDRLVRDPDTGISGTDIQEIDVVSTDLDMSEGFKVTEALSVVSPGADGPEVVQGSPTFVWADDSSEDGYRVVVYDAFGEMVWENVEVPRVTGSSSVELMYGGPALIPGMHYQFRATSLRDRGGEPTPISRTEDLRGVFVAG